MSKSNYTWLDESLFEESKCCFKTLVSMMQRHGGTWRQEWLKLIPYDRRSEILNELYTIVCNEMGYEETDVNIITVTAYKAIDEDQAVLARAEAKKRYLPIRKFFEDVATPTPEAPTLAGWLTVDYRQVTSHIGEIINVTNGVPQLVKDWEQRVRELCTNTLPEDYRPLCDLLRDNEAVCYGLVAAGDKVRLHAPWAFAFDDNGAFSLQRFGSRFI